MTIDSHQSAEIKKPHIFWWVGAGLLLAAALVLVFLRGPDSAEKAAEQPTFSVARGPLTISVSEAGTIRPREQIILKSEVEGQTVILFLIDEGTEVSKGDLLVELDASQLLDQRVNQQIQMINAEAAFINARENLSVVKSQTQADIDQAALDLDFSRQDLDQYQAGEYPKLVKEAEATITLAEETLTNARNTYEWSQKLFAEKYLSESELKRDELSWQKAKIDLELARDELNLLQNFTYKRRMAELDSAFSQAEMALERAKRKATADIVQAEAKLRASEAEFQQQQDKFAKIEEQIKKTKIYAPMDGTVIYATSTKMSWRSSSEPLDEGQAVRERQELIYLPTTVSYNAEIKIHESSLQKIRPGLPVRISIDALPGQQLSGRVASIAPLPDATSMFMNPDLKVYNSIIAIDGNGSSLRNGMSCQAEIIVAQFEDTLFVPVQAVVRIGTQPTVYVADGRQFKPRPVTPGLDNNRMIQILDGIEDGDLVLLTPPLGAAEKPAQGAVPEQQPTLPKMNQRPKASQPLEQPQIPPKRSDNPSSRSKKTGEDKRELTAEHKHVKTLTPKNNHQQVN
ncbi:MAG: HlyD family efflux transporter periplasmic adaptor subunit [Desulfuromonadales bacterium]|nr:HlyD family efflux transporter periplasmic adaptor subunit [Desulfuromonadales bacterium]MBN2793653.1 HlyD family efflux transporter periplasmic adaptor subunit [Desulfuromonadales bacterium]